MSRRFWLRMRTSCATWPCKRCDVAGRTSWRSREEWHRARRARNLARAEWLLYGVVVGLLIAGIYEAATR